MEFIAKNKSIAPVTLIYITRLDNSPLYTGAPQPTPRIELSGTFSNATIFVAFEFRCRIWVWSLLDEECLLDVIPPSFFLDVNISYNNQSCQGDKSTFYLLYRSKKHELWRPAIATKQQLYPKTL